MAEIPYLRTVASKGWTALGDCGIAALGTLLSQTYEDVVAVAVRLEIPWKSGMWGSQMVKIALEFGATLKKRRKYDLEHVTGLVMVNILDFPAKTKRVDHVVVVWRGILIDSDGYVWEPDAFISHYQAKLGELLELQ